MTHSKTQTVGARKPPAPQRTTSPDGVKRPGAADEPDAKLPHERDESAGNAADAPRGEGRKAYEDAARGVPDMDKGPPMDEAYRKVRRKTP